MLFELCKEINNWFEVSKHFGVVIIQNNSITINGVPLSDILIEGQYFRIVGSILNDGVYKFPIEDTLNDETFKEGAIWALAIPPQIIKLATDIQTWSAKYSDAVMSPFASESFSSYSYNKGSSSDGNSASWQRVFANVLNKWRKI